MVFHLTTHSTYSLQEGLASPLDLVQAAQKENMPALGMTDHNLLTGAVEFLVNCHETGIQPIIGLEIITDFGRLVLFAESMDGWSTLCKLSSVVALGELSGGVVPLDRLSDFSHDVIVLPYKKKSLKIIEGADGIFQGILDTLGSIFPNKLYIPLTRYDDNISLSLIAHKMDLPTVATHPVYYLHEKEASLQKTLAAIRENRPVQNIPSGLCAPRGGYFLGSHEMEKLFDHFPAAITAQLEIAERCRFEFQLGVSRMPSLNLPEGSTVTEFLKQKAEEGARRIYGKITPPIQQRLDHEISIIAQMGYEPIFLIVQEILNYAREKSIPYSSRGSAASSLVAHCLGITSPDPIRLNLFFERFLNPARSVPPDIDTDLCSRRRDEVINHVFNAYGTENVAMVGTINRFRPRSALRETAKAHGMDPGKIHKLVERLPYGFWARRDEENNDAQIPSPFEELRGSQLGETYKQIFDEADALLKVPRHLSVHPGGIVIAPGPITDIVPVMCSGSKGIVITQLDLGSVETLGLVKIDLLGIRGLSVLGDVAQFIFNSRPKEFRNPNAILDSTPLNDDKTADRIETGATIGCFQIESPGMRATLREIHARSQDDIMAALALYRPGPLTGGMKDSFVRRFKGEEPVKHLHPNLAPILSETFGVILYQEQVLRIANQIAGFNLVDADLLRRAMSHFDPGHKMDFLRHKFVNDSLEKSGIPPEVGEHLWDMMAAFTGYGFPKAHAASYSQVAWRSAWCKTNFPGEFMAAVLANWGGYYSQNVYLNEARRLNLKTRAPHINYSEKDFTYQIDAQGVKSLFMGLDQVKDITKRTMENIVAGKPFRTLEDFLIRADPQKKEAINLARVGALDGFGSIPDILKRLTKGWQSNQPSLFEETFQGNNEWTIQQKVDAQMELLGASPDFHPLDLIEKKVKDYGAISILEASGRIGQSVTIAGIKMSGHRSRTAKGELMMFLTLEDTSGILDVVLFPDTYKRNRDAIHTSLPLLIKGAIEMDGIRNEPILHVESVQVIN